VVVLVVHVRVDLIVGVAPVLVPPKHVGTLAFHGINVVINRLLVSPSVRRSLVLPHVLLLHVLLHVLPLLTGGFLVLVLHLHVLPLLTGGFLLLVLHLHVLLTLTLLPVLLQRYVNGK
jgi:hypothetical protein